MADPALLAQIPVLPRKKVWKHRKRYYRWRAPTALLQRGHRTRLPDDPDFPDFAIGVIALGSRFHRWSRTLIASLRSTGGYHGPVYVVTEAPDAFADLDNVMAIPVAKTRHQLVAKTCKTFLFEWIAQRHILYIDADIIVGQPIHGWYREAIAAQAEQATLFYPNPGKRKLPYHGGLILMDKTRSAPLFRHWRRTLNSGRFRQDQEALLTFADDYAVGYLPPGGMLFPDEAAIERGETACFIHLTSYRYRMLGHDRVAYYLEQVLGIPDAQGRLDFS